VKRDEERTGRLTRALEEAGVDALVCTLPTNVLLLSGYWPVVGTSLAVFTREGHATLLVPEDEKELAEGGWADEVRTFSAGSLTDLKGVVECVQEPLAEVASYLGIGREHVVGFEDGSVTEPVTYAAMHLYGADAGRLIGQAMRLCALYPAGELLRRLRSSLTPHEVGRVRVACRVAEEAFAWGAAETRAGLRETEVAARFRETLGVIGTCFEGVARADGFAFCMSGPNSAEAHAAFQLSRARRLRAGDLALVHCNSYVDGYWTDITRTFCLGEPTARKREMYSAVFAAREAALEAVRPGARAAEVDAAARAVLADRGFGSDFKHGLGHGVGFSAIDHNAPPRLHPASDDVLEEGMVFNVEPAIYIEGYGGMRHCDVVALTGAGAEVLTRFQSSVEQLTVT
jgi:Xaa-Pro aminopeptidase